MKERIKKDLKLFVVIVLTFVVFSLLNITDVSASNQNISETNTIALTNQSRVLKDGDYSFDEFIFNVKSTGGEIKNMAYSRDKKTWYRFQDKYRNLEYSKDKTEVKVTIRKSYKKLYVRIRNTKGVKILEFDNIRRISSGRINPNGDLSLNKKSIKCFKNQVTYKLRYRSGIYKIMYSTDEGKTYVDSTKFQDGIKTTIANDQKTAEVIVSKSFDKLKIKVIDASNHNQGVFKLDGYINKNSECKEINQTMVITEDNYLTYNKAEGRYTYKIEDKSGATINEMYSYDFNTKKWIKNNNFRPTKEYTAYCDMNECYHKYVNSNGVKKLYRIGVSSDIGVKYIINKQLLHISKGIITVSNQTYTGSEVKPSVIVRYDGKTLVEGNDYIVSYSNNVKPGTASVIVKGIGFYTGAKKQTFVIEKTGTQTNTPTTPKKNDTKTQNKVVKTNKIKLIGLTANQCKNPPINYSIDAAADNSGNIAKVEYSIDNGKTFNKSTKCSINGKKASCSITGRYKSIIYRVTTTGNHYQVFGKYCSQK